MIKKPKLSTEEVNEFVMGVIALLKSGAIDQLSDVGIVQMPGTPYHMWVDPCDGEDGGYTHVLDLRGLL